jgi:ABC-type transport system substrate-binding protein
VYKEPVRLVSVWLMADRVGANLMQWRKRAMGLSRRQFLQTAALMSAGFSSGFFARGIRVAGAASQAGQSGLVPYAQYYEANPPKAWKESEIERGGSLTIPYVGDPPHFDPALTTSYYMLGAIGPVYDRLIHSKWGTYRNPSVPELEPDLAETWDVSPDHLYVSSAQRRQVAESSAAQRPGVRG